MRSPLSSVFRGLAKMSKVKKNSKDLKLVSTEEFV